MHNYNIINVLNVKFSGSIFNYQWLFNLHGCVFNNSSNSNLFLKQVFLKKQVKSLEKYLQRCQVARLQLKTNPFPVYFLKVFCLTHNQTAFIFLIFRNMYFLGALLSGYFRQQRENDLIRSFSEKSCSGNTDNSEVRDYSEMFFCFSYFQIQFRKVSATWK